MFENNKLPEIEVNPEPIPEQEYMENVLQLMEPGHEEPMLAIDSNKIQTLEDVKAILGALKIIATQDIIKQYHMEHLVLDEDKSKLTLLD